MTDKELDALATDLVDTEIANAVKNKIAEKYYRDLNKDKCTHCGSKDTFKFRKVTGIHRCKNCGSYFGKDYLFVFPDFAKNPRRNFLRALCLQLNWQDKREYKPA